MRPMSPVRFTCVPPQSSTDHALLAPGATAPIDTTRTSSPYFSPNSAIAPEARASSSAISRVSTGVFSSSTALAMSSTALISSALIGLVCEKSKRRRSGETSEPFCATWVPSTWRSASCRRCVAEWLARVADAAARDRLRARRLADLKRALLDLAEVDEQIAELLLRVGDAEQRAALAPLIDDPWSPTWPPTLAVERRLVEDERAFVAGLEGIDFLAARDEREQRCLPPSRCRSRGTRWRRSCSLISNQTVSVAASPEPFQAAFAASFCFFIAASNASVSTAMPRGFKRVLGQIEREAEGVVELEGDVARKDRALLRARRTLAKSFRPLSSVFLNCVSSSFSVSVISACAAHELGIGVAHLAHERRHEAVHQRLVRSRAGAA